MYPQTQYAWLGDDRIAYQVLGQGPPDLVVTHLIRHVLADFARTCNEVDHADLVVAVASEEPAHRV
jgi:hypothetical protein